MEKEDIDFVDKVRKEWFQAEGFKTPISLLKSIPSTIRRLINIIDKLQDS